MSTKSRTKKESKVKAKSQAKPVESKGKTKPAQAKPRVVRPGKDKANVKTAKPVAPKADALPALPKNSPVQFRVLTANLLAALNATAKTLNKKSTLPVLANWLIEANKSQQVLRVTTTNLEQATWWQVPAIVNESVSMCFPYLTDGIVANWDEGVIDCAITPKTQTAKFTGEKFHANLKGIDPKEFPVIPQPSQDLKLTLSQDAIAEIVACVCPCAAKDESRPVLTGVSLKATRNGKKTTVEYGAADGFRLGRITRTEEAEWGDEKAKEFSAIVPASAFLHTARALPQDGSSEDDDGLVTLCLGASQAQFVTARGGTITQLVDGKFPDIQRIIPEIENCKSLHFASLADLQAAVDFAAVLARESLNTVRIALDEKHTGLTVSAASAESGDNARVFDLHPHADKANMPKGAFEFAFNATYLKQALAAFGYGDGIAAESGVNLLAASAASPMQLYRPALNGASDFTTVIMPMHVEGSSGKAYATYDDKGKVTKEVAADSVEGKSLIAKVKSIEAALEKGNGTCATCHKPIETCDCETFVPEIETEPVAA